MKKLLWISTVCLFVLFITGCNSNNVENGNESGNDNIEKEKNTSEQGAFHIDLSGDIREDEEKFIVEGKSNLLPNSILIAELIVDEGDTVFSEATAKVAEDGSFEMDLDHHIYGDAEIVIRFDFENARQQEDEIFEHYGEDGENLEGPFVYRYTNYDKKKAEVTIPYSAREENDLTIRAPEWEERPEDYGDGRVWFDDVKVEEDGEYFYVSGKTNLVEGASLLIRYFGTNGRTRVLPDGTFETKFDYEYHEGKDMEIKFEPNDNPNQWKHVQEVYGNDGAEFVGDLVEQSDYGKGYQMILYPIDWSEEE